MKPSYNIDGTEYVRADVTTQQLIAERKEAIMALRGLCENFGDNGWEDDLHLADIINKHLAPYLYENEE